MKCKKCKEEIDHVLVISKCTQRGNLERDVIVAYDSVDNVGKTISIHCPKCDYDLKGKVRE